MTRQLFFFLGSILFLFTMHSAVVMACTSPPSFQVDNLSLMDLWVKATVIDTDDRGFNAILRVEDYYKGDGERLLVVMRYPIGLETGNKVRGYATSCLYSGHGERLHKGSQGYFGLNSNNNGTFTDILWGQSAHFYVWDDQITLHDSEVTGYTPPFIWMSETEFLDKLRHGGGHDEPIAPTIDDKQYYPLMRFLNITTENGTRYQVNPDRSVQQVPEDAPLAISPDGAHVAFKLDENTIAFQSIWTEYGYVDESSEPLPAELMEQNQKIGLHVRFSNDSNMVAVWDDTHLSIYLFDSQEVRYFGNQLRLTEVINTDLNTPTNVIWSADSSTLAWEDDTGIWHWNLFDSAEAMKISDSSGLLDISTYGRYVRIGQAEDWTLYDTQTGETFANAISAPTEQFLIFVNSDETPIQDWESAENCKPPLRDNCAVYINPRIEYETFTVFPYQMELFGSKGCSAIDFCDIYGVSWHPSVGDNNWRGDRYIYVFKGGVRQIIYDVFYDQPAILTGDYQIEFEFYPTDVFDRVPNLPLDYLNLEGEIDSPIASIEWGQPIFYDTFMLTATPYLP